jgi:mRNA interferase MazF
VKAPEPSRGDVWFADIIGEKKRPVLVVTRDPMGRHLHSVICAPITSTIRGISTEVVLGSDAGLKKDSVANFDNMFLLPRTQLLRWLGRADDEQMTAVCAAVAVAIGCRSFGRL